MWGTQQYLLWGNGKTDPAVQSTLDLPLAKVDVPCNDFKHKINDYILSNWQDHWSGAVVGPSTGNAGRMKLSWVVPTSVIHI